MSIQSVTRPLSLAETTFVTTVLEPFDHQFFPPDPTTPDFEITSSADKDEQTSRFRIATLPAVVQTKTFNYAVNFKHWVNMTQLFELHQIEVKYRQERIKAIQESAKYFITKRFQKPLDTAKSPIDQLSELIIRRPWNSFRRNRIFKIYKAYDYAQLDIARRTRQSCLHIFMLSIRNICARVWNHRVIQRIANFLDCKIVKIALGILAAIALINFLFTLLPIAKTICIFPLNKALAFGKLEGVISTMIDIWQEQFLTCMFNGALLVITQRCPLLVQKTILMINYITTLPVKICLSIIGKIGDTFLEILPVNLASHFFEWQLIGIHYFSEGPVFLVFSRWKHLESDWTKLMSHSLA